MLHVSPNVGPKVGETCRMNNFHKPLLLSNAAPLPHHHKRTLISDHLLLAASSLASFTNEPWSPLPHRFSFRLFHKRTCSRSSDAHRPAPGLARLHQIERERARASERARGKGRGREPPALHITEYLPLTPQGHPRSRSRPCTPPPERVREREREERGEGESPRPPHR